MLGPVHVRLQIFQLVQRDTGGRTGPRGHRRQRHRTVEVLRARVEQRAHHVDREPVVVRVRSRSRGRIEHVLRPTQTQQVSRAPYLRAPSAPSIVHTRTGPNR